MRNDHQTVRTSAAAPRPLLALVLAVCLLVSALPTAWASSVGSGPSSLTRSTAPTYVKLSRSVLIFQGDTYGNGASLTLPAGTVCQLYSENYYTASDGLQYHSLYYLNTRYNVLRTDIQGDIMTAAEVETYITGTLWKQTTYSTLRERDGLVGDIRVHAVQLALSRLGYYTGALDGDYGEKTNEAMKQFQRKNGLDPDGSAGPLSQPVLFALASGSTVPGTGGSSGGGSSSSGGSSGSGSTSNGSTAPSSGTLKTTASVNLRKSASTSSARLAVVPKGVNLSYTETYVRSGVTWFKVRYNSLTGWLMGTFVSAAGNASSPAIGTVTITMPGTRVRDAADGNKTGTVLAKGTVVDLNRLKNLPPEQQVIVTTGSQGEEMSALYRMAFSTHKQIDVGPTDKVIISASAIPGNEVTVGRVINELFRKGVDVVYDKADMLHVSGHACQEELKIIHALTKPRFFIPLHGEQRMLQIHKRVAESMGMNPNNIVVADNGSVIEITGKHIKCETSVPAGEVFVDGSGVGEVGAVVLNDRRLLAEDGMVVVVLPMSSHDHQLLCPPEIVTRGFVYVKESEELLHQLRDVAQKTVDAMSARKRRDDGEVSRAVRSAVSSYLYKHTKRSPMVIPMVTKL